MSTMEPFSVRVETRAPRDARDALPGDAAADDLMDMLEDCDGVVSSGPGSWDAIVTVLASGPREAADTAATMIEAWAAKAGMPGWPAVRVEAVRQDLLAEQLEHPSLPDLVSAPEAADILGVKPQRIHQLVIEHRDFPEPAYELRAGKLWLRAAVEAFAERKRGPGRPRKAAVAAVLAGRRCREQWGRDSAATHAAKPHGWRPCWPTCSISRPRRSPINTCRSAAATARACCPAMPHVPSAPRAQVSSACWLSCTGRSGIRTGTSSTLTPPHEVCAPPP